MDISTFSMLIDVANAEHENRISDEEREDVRKTLGEEGLLETVSYDQLINALENFRIMRSSVYTAVADAIDSMFNKAFDDISLKDWKFIESSFLEELGSPDSALSFPTRVGGGMGVLDDIPEAETLTAEELRGEEIALDSINVEEEELKNLFRNHEEVDPVTIAGFLYEVEDEEDKESEYPAFSSDQGKALTKLMYTMTQAVSMGIGAEALAQAFSKSVENNGADYASFHETAEDIVKTVTAEGALPGDWNEMTPEFYTHIAKEFKDSYENVFASEEQKEKGERELERVVLTLGSPEVSLFLYTDSSIEDLVATGVVKENGERELRKVTSAATFTSDLSPDPNGILSEQIFGPLRGQGCTCGKCNSAEATVDAKNGAVCPDCHEPVMTSKDRDYTYAVVESPFPLLAGRNELIAAMLDSSLWNGEEDFLHEDSGLSSKRVVDMFEECSPDVFYQVRNGKGRIFVRHGNNDLPQLKAGEERIYGPEGLERALQDLGKQTIQMGKREIPLALYNALKKVEYYNTLQMPGEKKSAYSREKAQEKWREAVNYYRSLKNFLIDRQGRPEDLLLHYLLITPPGTRPVNNRQSTTRYGEVNEALLPLIEKLTLASKLKEADVAATEDMLRIERDYADYARDYTKLARDDINKKNKLIYSDLLTVKADNICRGVINPSDHLDGQKWYREKVGLNIPTMDLIGLPRSLARNMYKTEIYKLLQRPGVRLDKPEGYTKEEIDNAFLVPPNTIETMPDGTKRRCLIDEALESIMINKSPKSKHGRGQIVTYNRQPIITNGSIQAGYAYLHDGETILIASQRTLALNADFDGDQMMAVKIMSPAAREEMKRHMNQTMFDDSTGELLVGPRHEALVGLLKMSEPAETYTFDRPVIINEDRLKELEKSGAYKDGRITKASPLFVNHVINEVTGMKLTKEPGTTIPAGEVYAVTSDGKNLIADEKLYIKESGGRLFAVTPFEDFVMAPKGSNVPSAHIIEPGEKVCKIYNAIEDASEIKKGLFNGMYTYNQPITVEHPDGTLEETTPGRMMLERIFGHALPFKDKGLSNKDWKAILTDEISAKGREHGKDLISRLTQFGFDAVNFTNLKQTPNDFPTTKSVDKELYYSDDDVENANVKIYGMKEELRPVRAKLLAGCKMLTEPGAAIKKGDVYGIDPDGKELVAEVDSFIAKTPNGNTLFLSDSVLKYGNDKLKALSMLQSIIIDLEEQRSLTRDKRKIKSLTNQIKKKQEMFDTTKEHLRYMRDVTINEIRNEKYEKLTAENGKKVIEQMSHYKNNYVKGSIDAGIKGWGLVTSMVDIGPTKDYLGNIITINGGNLVEGNVGITRTMNDSTAPINGNKTIDVDMIGAVSNTLASVTESSLYEVADCGTTVYEEANLWEGPTEQQKDRLNGRVIAEDVTAKDGTVVASKGDFITPELLEDVYTKGARGLKYRSALGCKCAGTCSVCAGKIKGNTPVEGASIGITARQALIAPSYQGVMNRAKAAGEGTKSLSGSETIKALLKGDFCDLKDTEEYPISVFELAQRYRDSFYSVTTTKQLQPVYAEVIAKAFINYVDKHGLPKTLADAINQGIDVQSVANTGVINSNPGLFMNEEMAYMTTDKKCTRFGAYLGKEKADIPLVRPETEYNKRKIASALSKTSRIKAS